MVILASVFRKSSKDQVSMHFSILVSGQVWARTKVKARTLPLGGHHSGVRFWVFFSKTHLDYQTSWLKRAAKIAVNQLFARSLASATILAGFASFCYADSCRWFAKLLIFWSFYEHVYIPIPGPSWVGVGVAGLIVIDMSGRIAPGSGRDTFSEQSWNKWSESEK